MPTERKRHFADRKARNAYGVESLPVDYTIIFVDDKDTFRNQIEGEASTQNASGYTPFTTDSDFYLMNFVLDVDNDHYNYVRGREGWGQLVLSCDSNNTIIHLERFEM
jgi:hypothetical protein